MSENEKSLSKSGEQKPEKKKEKKPFFLVRAAKGIHRWLREMRGELKKVVWPAPKQAAHNTGVVIICVIIIGAFIWVFDWVAGTGVQALIVLIRGY